ncbi:hypothetical protein L3Q82_026847 [Scortum barcoo]|uniref:Uncharacterized protein n=1 Tax=Scortum barcoo TaxID=214431 RepID=A0ACB8WJT4_9TELE|nr:hypothetical protein L3Q82_026847 [Scortum barcoo]
MLRQVRSGDRLALRAARRQLTAGVKRAKAAYAQRIQGHFTSNDPRTPDLPPHQEKEPLRVTAAEVRRTLQRINPRKAAGPDNISGRVLKGCAYQLTEVLTDIFNTSLQQAAVVPTLNLPEDRHDHPHPQRKRPQ